MTNTWSLCALWVGLALAATLLAIWFKVSTALSEIVVGTVAQLVIGVFLTGIFGFAQGGLAGNTQWITFLAGTGAIVLTFLAGAELDPAIFKTKWKEASVIGLAGFFGPFFGCTAIAHYVLHWAIMPSWLCGVALSTTSVAVVYAVMLELGFNVTEYGKAILAACFINDLGTVIALGLIFSPFTIRTLIFVAVSIVVFIKIRRTRLRVGSQVSSLFSLRHGRTCRLGWKRSGATGLHDRHGPRRYGRKRPFTDSPPAYTHIRITHAVLLHPRGIVCFGAGIDGSTCNAASPVWSEVAV
jgi:Kef-type K+ transport system membrane component KefB